MGTEISEKKSSPNKSGQRGFRMIDAHSMARREMARERARIHRKKKERISFLGEEAMKWKREKAETSVQKEKIAPLAEVSALPQLKGQKISSLPKLKKNQEETGDWQQYNPWKNEEEEKNERQVSSATIQRLARKLIAKEWVKAKGIKPRDPGLSFFEQQAAQWKTKKEKEEK